MRLERQAKVSRLAGVLGSSSAGPIIIIIFLFSQFIFWPLFPPNKYCWEVTEVHVFPLVQTKAGALRLHVHYSGCTTPPSTFLIIVPPSEHRPLHCTDYPNHTVLISNNLSHCSGCIFDNTSQASNYYRHHFHSVPSLFSGFECQLLILLQLRSRRFLDVLLLRALHIH